jgi:hypothetical protein
MSNILGGSRRPSLSGIRTLSPVVRNADNVVSVTEDVDQLPAPTFFVAPPFVAGDFGLSRWRYDSPSITRS